MTPLSLTTCWDKTYCQNIVMKSTVPWTVIIAIQSRCDCLYHFLVCLRMLQTLIRHNITNLYNYTSPGWLKLSISKLYYLEGAPPTQVYPSVGNLCEGKLGWGHWGGGWPQPSPQSWGLLKGKWKGTWQNLITCWDKTFFLNIVKKLTVLITVLIAIKFKC